MKITRKSFITTTALGGSALAAGSFSSLTTGGKERLLHHVFFWLKNPNSKEDLASLITGLRTLKKIKTVRKMYIGVPAATEDRSVIDNSYNVSELLFFNDLAGQKAYQDDPIHLKFVQQYSHLWDKVVVYDTIEI